VSLAFNPDWVQVHVCGSGGYSCAFCGQVLYEPESGKYLHDSRYQPACPQRGMSFLVPPMMFLAQKPPAEQPLSHRPIDNATGCDSGQGSDHAEK
jgi:hypothetical protein